MKRITLLAIVLAFASTCFAGIPLSAPPSPLYVTNRSADKLRAALGVLTNGSPIDANVITGNFTGTWTMTMVQGTGTGIYGNSAGNSTLGPNASYYGLGFAFYVTNDMPVSKIKACIGGTSSSTNASIMVWEVATNTGITGWDGFTIWLNAPLYSNTVTLPTYSPSSLFEHTPTGSLTLTNRGIAIVFFLASATNGGALKVAYRPSSATGTDHPGLPYAVDGVTLLRANNGVNYSSAGISVEATLSLPVTNFTSYVASMGSSGSAVSNATQVTFNNANAGLGSTTIDAALTQVATNALLSIPRVIMPSDITAVVGEELQIFVRGVLEWQNPFELNYGFYSAKGMNYPRYWDYTPVVGDIGTTTLGFSVFNRDGGIVASNYGTVTIVGAGSAPSSNICVLCCGDSLTAAGVWPAEFYRRLTQSGGTPTGNAWGNVRFVGDQQMSSYAGQYFMGYGGWQFSTYLSTATNSAAWITAAGHDKDITDIGSRWIDANGQQWTLMQVNGNYLKVGNYAGAGGHALPAQSGTLTNTASGTHTGVITFTATSPTIQSPLNNTNGFSFAATNVLNGTNVTVCYLLLGWNTELGYSTANPYSTNYTDYLTNLTTFATRLRADHPNALLRVMGLQAPSPGGLAYNYGATGLSSQYFQLLRSVNGMNQAYDLWCSTNSFARFIPVAAEFDSDNNMPTTTAAVNTRNPALETRGNNGVHPANAGYYQIADAAWRDFVRSFCQ